MTPKVKHVYSFRCRPVESVAASQLLWGGHCLVGHLCHIAERDQRPGVDCNCLAHIHHTDHTLSVRDSVEGTQRWWEVQKVSGNAIKESKVLTNTFSTSPVKWSTASTRRPHRRWFRCRRMCTRRCPVRSSSFCAASFPSTIPCGCTRTQAPTRCP